MRIRALVSGDVQGVGFRDFIRREAAALELAGWVANRPDGRVEVVAEGTGPALDRLATRLREGPRLARVAGVDVRREPATGEFDGFSIASGV